MCLLEDPLSVDPSVLGCNLFISAIAISSRPHGGKKTESVLCWWGLLCCFCVSLQCAIQRKPQRERAGHSHTTAMCNADCRPVLRA